MNTHNIYAPEYNQRRFYGILAALILLGYFLYQSGIASSSDQQADVLSNGFAVLAQAVPARLIILVPLYFIWILALGGLLGYTFSNLKLAVRERNNNDSLIILVLDLTFASAIVLADVGLAIPFVTFLIYFVVRAIIMLSVGIFLAFVFNLPFHGFLTGKIFHDSMTKPGGDDVARITGRAMIIAAIVTAVFI